MTTVHFRPCRWYFSLACIVGISCLASTALAEFYPIDVDTRIDSRDFNDNYDGDSIKIVKNDADPGDGSMVRGLIKLNLPSLPIERVDSAKLWMCLTYDQNWESEDPYARGVALHPLTRNFDEGTATWMNSDGSTPWGLPGGDYDTSNSVSWNPPLGITHRTNGYWWCSWDIKPLWDDSNLRDNGAALILDPETPPTDFISKVFASSDYGDSSYRPYVEVNEVPEPSTVAMLVAGAGLLALGLVRRVRSEKRGLRES